MRIKPSVRTNHRTRPHHPRIAIYGQYKSGTTALYFAVRKALPQETRLLYESVAYESEPEDTRRPVLAKVILGAPEPDWEVRHNTFSSFGKKIYLIRDPRDWLVSGALFLIQQDASIYSNDERLDSVLKLLRQKESAPRSLSLLSLLRHLFRLSTEHSFEEVIAWMVRQKQWLQDFESTLKEHYVFRYEDLVDRRVEGLEDYLQLPVPLDAVLPETQRHVVRTKSYGNWKHWWLEEDVSFFRPLFDPYLQRHDYPAVWTLAERPVIPAEHCSQYVIRTVNRRKAVAQMDSTLPMPA
jgi:hypothetical protein